MRRASVLVLVFVAVLAATLTGGGPFARLGAQDGTPGADFVGSWLVTVAPDVAGGTTTWPALATFDSDGSMVAAGTPVILTPPGSPFPKVVASTGQGSWESTGDGAIAFTFVLILSEEGGTAHAVATVAGVATLDASGDAWTGEYTATVVGQVGRIVAVGHGTLEGTRIVVQPMATPTMATPTG